MRHLIILPLLQELLDAAMEEIKRKQEAQVRTDQGAAKICQATIGMGLAEAAVGSVD